jgi:hypothetical protein
MIFTDSKIAELFMKIDKPRLPVHRSFFLRNLLICFIFVICVICGSVFRLTIPNMNS